MLPATARLTAGESFRRCVREGRRSGSRTMVVHVCVDDESAGVRAGFVVGKSVGGAVVRNRVRRRLRHLVRDRLADLPAGAAVVVRALPAAAAASYAELREDLGRCLERATPLRRHVTTP